MGRYVSEFEGRHNRRSFDTDRQMETMARAAEGNRLRRRDLVEG